MSLDLVFSDVQEVHKHQSSTIAFINQTSKKAESPSSKWKPQVLNPSCG